MRHNYILQTEKIFNRTYQDVDYMADALKWNNKNNELNSGLF